MIAYSFCEKVREDISHNLLPEFQLSVDNLIKPRLKEVSETVEAQVKSNKEDMKDLAELKTKLLASDITEHSIAKPCPKPIISPLVTNPTSHIKEYRENFISAIETTELKTILKALLFSKVSGRSVASFGEEYHYNGAPKSNSLNIPNPISDKKSIKLSLINTMAMLIYQNSLIMNQQLVHIQKYLLLQLVMS